MAPVVALKKQRGVSVSVFDHVCARWHQPYLHDQLVGAGHQCEAVGVVKGLRDVLAERVAGPSGGDAPAAAVVRVRPQQVAHGPLRKGRERERELEGRIGAVT